MRETRRIAFTLVELLVVIAIIALLLSILMPSLARARAQARRVVCASTIKSTVAVAIMYSNDDRQGRFAPTGGTYQGYIERCATRMDIRAFAGMAAYITPGISAPTVNPMVPMSPGTARELVKKVFVGKVRDAWVCPEWKSNKQYMFYADLMPDPSIKYYMPYAFLLSGWANASIGYNYLGGMQTSTWDQARMVPDARYFEVWKSADKNSDPGNRPLLMDWGRYVPYSGGPWSSVPLYMLGHTDRGFQYKISADVGIGTAGDPTKLPGAGANVGCADGSVKWSLLRNLKCHMVYANGSVGATLTPQQEAFWF